MIHKIISVTFYQTITFHEESIRGRKAFNTLDTILLPDVEIERVGESIVITHKDFKDSYCVGMANVRHYRFEKPKELSEAEKAASALERNKNNPVNLKGSEDLAPVDSIGPNDTMQGELQTLIGEKANDSKDLRSGTKKKTKKKVTKKCSRKKKKQS